MRAVNIHKVKAFGNLPLSFEINQGQTHNDVNFLARGRGYTLFLTPSEAVFSLRMKPEEEIKHFGIVNRPTDRQKAAVSEFTAFKMKLVGANSNPEISKLVELPGKVNYFIGNDPTKWRTEIPTYSKIKYHDVYPGIDVVYYGQDGQLEYDFIVAPGADPSSIVLNFDGVDDIEIDDQGNLVLNLLDGHLLLKKPMVYQLINNGRKEVDSEYCITTDKLVTLKLGSIDKSQPVIIDPVIVYSTYLGGSLWENGAGIAVDNSGSAYVTGETYSSDFPQQNPIYPYTGGSGYSDVFVSKFDPSGTALVYSTYVGGMFDDYGTGIAVDSSGEAYVAGVTGSPNFPVKDPIQATIGGTPDAFVFKLNASGTALVYSTYLGGSDLDAATDIAIDHAGAAYVTGSTRSTDFPLQNPVQATKSGGSDVFVTKIDPLGNTLVYSTYLGGSGQETGQGIAVDSSGAAFVAGGTSSPNFPLQNPLQSALAGATDVFVSKLDPSGKPLIYSTYLGGTGDDTAYDIAVDSSGAAYVTGYTNSSTSFPLTNPIQPAYGGGFSDAFVFKLDPAGTGLVYSTFLGGLSGDQGFSIAVDSTGAAYVAGNTTSINFPLKNPIQEANAGGSDAFIAKIAPSGTTLAFSTYLGGEDNDVGNDIAVDNAGGIYVVGQTRSSNFPVLNAIQPTLAGYYDAFITKLAEQVAQADLSLTKAHSADPVFYGENLTYTVAITNNGPDPATGVIVTDTLPTGVSVVAATSTKGTVDEAGGIVTNNIGDMAVGEIVTLTIVVTPSVTGSITNTTEVTGNEFDPDTTNNTAIDTVNVEPSADLSITKSTSTNPAIIGINLTYTVTVVNNGPSPATGVVVTDTLPADVTYVSATSTKGAVSETGGGVTNNIGEMAVGETVTLTIVVTPTVTGSITNTTEVTGTEHDPNLTNNTATNTLNVKDLQACIYLIERAIQEIKDAKHHLRHDKCGKAFHELLDAMRYTSKVLKCVNELEPHPDYDSGSSSELS